MLVACRLAGLSALEGHYAGVNALAQISPCGVDICPPAFAGCQAVGSEARFPVCKVVATILPDGRAVRRSKDPSKGILATHPAGARSEAVPEPTAA
jgi:hypothetical protein